jgi:hypothetical protein
MKFLRLLHLGIITILASSTFASASDYPPEILDNPNQYPPLATNSSQWDRLPPPTKPAMPRVPTAPGMPQPRFNANAYQRPYSGTYARSYPRSGYAARNYPRPYAQPYPGYYGRYPGYPAQRSFGYNNSYNANRLPYRSYSRQRNNNRFPFSGGNMPFMGNGNNSFGNFSNPMNNMFGGSGNRSNNFINNSGSLPFFKQSKKKRKKAWGDKRNIWPDFYTDFTDESWDTMSSAPRDLGEMPGGWHFPLISTPDPVTVSDAITNQFPPIAEEAGNMMDFSNWGLFDNK